MARHTTLPDNASWTQLSPPLNKKNTLRPLTSAHSTGTKETTFMKEFLK